MSSYKSDDLFGSGPHRFVLGRAGMQLIPWSIILDDDFETGAAPIGAVDDQVVVEGRLVASSASALRDLRDDVIDAADYSNAGSPGTLVDNQGHSYVDMTLYRYEEQGAVEHGRVWSVAYVATFRRFVQKS